MAFRNFRDSAGGEWQVYDVWPQAPEERRKQDRRQSNPVEAGSLPHANRRVFEREFDRRVSIGSRPSGRIVQPWLCFERGETRCRLSPIPDDWVNAPDDQLERWCREAKPAVRPE